MSELVDSSQASPSHWSELVKLFTDKQPVCTEPELLIAMNSILLPYGPVRGMNNNFWILEVR
jgi:hypothetical protein